MEGTEEASIIGISAGGADGRPHDTVEASIWGCSVIFSATPGKYQVGDKVQVVQAGNSLQDGYKLATPEVY